MAGTAGGADPADHCQHHVLGGHPRGQLALDAYQQILHFLGDQTLGGEHVLHFRGADAVRECPEGTVGGGVGIAAHQGHPRQGGALLRSDDVHDPLAAVVHLVFEDAVLGAVVVQGLDLDARHRVGDRRDAEPQGDQHDGAEAEGLPQRSAKRG